MIALLSLELEGEPIKRERPDFLLRLRDGRTVGVEIVRALNEQVARGRGTRARLKRQIRDALVAAKINGWVNIRLDEHTAGWLNDNPADLRNEIAAIVELVRVTMNNGPEARWYNFSWIDHELEELTGEADEEADADLANTGIEHVDALGIYPRDEPLVTWSCFGRGQSPNIVQDAIDDKADDLVIYRECGADEVWLLVIGSAGTGGALFVDDVEDRVFVSAYDRTIFLELFEGRCVALETTPPT